MRILLIFIFFSFTLLSTGATAQVYTYPSDNYDPAGTGISSRFKTDEIKGCAPFLVNIFADQCGAGFLSKGDNSSTRPVPQPKDTVVYKKPGTYTLSYTCQGGYPTDVITITVLPNTKPSFDLFACPGNSAYVKITDTNYDTYWVQYPNAALDKTLTTGQKDIQPLPAASNTIKVRGRYTGAADNCDDQSKTINAISAFTIPTISILEVKNAAQIDLTYSEQAYVLYSLEIKPNSLPTFQGYPANISNTGGLYSVTNAINADDLNNNFYCFRMKANDVCNNVSQPYSNILCSINLKATAINKENDVTWTTSSPVTNPISNFSLDRNTSTLANPIASTATLYQDKVPSITCNITYPYKLMAFYNTGKSISMSKSATAISVGPPLPITYVGSEVNADDTSVKLTWDRPASLTEYNIFKSTGGGTYTSLATLATELLTDDNYTSTACYKIVYEDLCNNKTDINTSDEYCPIHVTASLNKDNSYTLSWSAYKNVTTYTIEKYGASGNLIQTISGWTSTTYPEPAPSPGDNQVYQYKIIAEQNPSLPTISNTITVAKHPAIFYPQAFTPNNDGLNDSFFVKGLFVNGFELKIFNRWGEIMFSTDNMSEGWDGNYHGLAMPEGTYVFTADLTDEQGQTFKRSGSVLLLRKK